MVFKKLKTAAAKQWLIRHVNDPYVQKAIVDNLRNRAAYKLQQINDKYCILRKGDNVLELGAAPGGWSQIILSIIGIDQYAPRLIGLDLLPIDALSGAKFIKKNFFDADLYQVLCDMMFDINYNITCNQDSKGINIMNQIRRDNYNSNIDKGLFNAILSDMSPNLTGNNALDHMRIIAFTERIVVDFLKLLKVGGNFVVKLFDGSELCKFVADMRTKFTKVYIFKPSASRKKSSELYCICMKKL